MKIIRYLDPRGEINYGCADLPAEPRRIAGDIFGPFEVTPEPARVAKLLAPVAPPNILCIGLNYRRHAEENRREDPRVSGPFHQGDQRPPEPGRPDRPAAASSAAMRWTTSASWPS